MPSIGREFIKNHLEIYQETQGVLPEKLEKFGKRYREKQYLSREELYEIAYESSTRSAHHVKQNSKRHCEEITENAYQINEDLSKIGLITLLKGFKAPTASCVIASLDPEKHAVVDTRVWASLERKNYLESRKESFKPIDYVKMIKPIREIAEKTGYTTAEVGYSLFAYDYKVREGTLH